MGRDGGEKEWESGVLEGKGGVDVRGVLGLTKGVFLSPPPPSSPLLSCSLSLSRILYLSLTHSI